MRKQNIIVKFTFIAIFGILLISISCKNSKKLPEGVHEITIKEVIQTSDYTYLSATENNAEIWLALPTMIASAGEVYYYRGGMKMTDFPSKQLNRTFKEILFLDELSKTPDFPKKDNGGENLHGMNNMMNMTSDSTSGSMPKVPVQKLQVKIDAVKGGITVGELYAKKNEYAGKTVKIKGQVSKFNPEIMGKNWIHIQDGTESGGEFDLTTTSNITVKVGDIITLEGKISLDKDFGYGYVYKVIMEDAVLVK